MPWKELLGLVADGMPASAAKIGAGDVVVNPVCPVCPPSMVPPKEEEEEDEAEAKEAAASVEDEVGAVVDVSSMFK